MDWAEYNKRRLRNEERLAVMQMDMLERSFDAALDTLSDRLSGVKGVKRDRGMIKFICRRLLEAALGDCPEDLAAQILRQSRDYCLGLERKSVTRRQEECVMPLCDEWQFIHIALDARCGLCMLDEAGCRACGVRQLLRRYCDEPEPGSLTACGFQGCDLSDHKRIGRQERL